MNTSQRIPIDNPVPPQPHLFPLRSLPAQFRCISSIDFTYHYHLYRSVDNWIATLLPLLQLLVSSFYLKYIFLFCRRDILRSCPFDPVIQIIQAAIPSWNLSRHVFLSNTSGDNISCRRSFLLLSPVPLSTPSLFTPSSFPSFPSISSWISPIFNSYSFSLLTTPNLSSLQVSPSPCTPFHSVKVYDFTTNDDSIPLAFNHAICDPSHPVPEPHHDSLDGIFDGWFGIPFSSIHYVTHVKAPHPTEILSLYKLDVLIPLYPTITSSTQIRSLVLHTIPLTVIQHLATTFLSKIVPPIIPSSHITRYASINTHCISHCFTLQPMPAITRWKQAYHDDPDTRVLIDRLSINSPLDQPTILQLPAAYRISIARNLLGLFEGRLVYYDPVPTVSKHICLIVVPLSLRRTIFTLMHATHVAGYMSEYKTLYRIKLRFFWPRLRSDVADWMKQCAHCLLTTRWRCRGQELMFSWPVSSPFAILDVDL